MADRIFRPGKKAAIALALLLAALLAGAILLGGCAALGAKPEGDRLARIRQSPAWHDEQFHNARPVWKDVRSALWESLRPSADRPLAVPDAPLPVLQSDGRQLQSPPPSGVRVTWFGHASSLVEIDGTRVLIDPIWSERASPVAWAGPARWYAPPIALKDLPPIDAVVISHDHYDHLDRATVEAINAAAGWNTVFIVPLGIGTHLARWGVPETRIVELDWWQSARIGAASQVEVVATPARHTSGRVSTSSNVTFEIRSAK